MALDSVWRSVAKAEGESPAVLVIEDDRAVAEMFGRALRDAGFDVTVAYSGTEGILAARQRGFIAILVDFRLPDLDGLEVLRRLSAHRNSARLVVVSAYLTVKMTVEAMKLGVSEVLEKPVRPDQIVSAVTTAPQAPANLVPEAATTAAPRALPLSAGVDNSSIARRWAADAMKGCMAPHDLKTLAAWARTAGTSVTMLSERCAMLGIKPHDARDLVRALFAMLASREERCTPYHLLDIGDNRTLEAFRRKAGPYFLPAHDMAAIDLFLDTQTFVDPHNYGMRVLRVLLAKVSQAIA